jgi:hypothetical protein
LAARYALLLNDDTATIVAVSSRGNIVLALISFPSAGHAWTSLSDDLASQGIQLLLDRRRTTTKMFSEKDFKQSLICLAVTEKMRHHIEVERADIQAKFGHTPTISAELLERLAMVQSRVDSGYYNMDIKDSTDLPSSFITKVKEAVREVQHSTPEPAFVFSVGH